MKWYELLLLCSASSSAIGSVLLWCKWANDLRSLPCRYQLRNRLSGNGAEQDAKPSMSARDTDILPGWKRTQQRTRIERFWSQPSPHTLNGTVCKCRHELGGN